MDWLKGTLSKAPSTLNRVNLKTEKFKKRRVKCFPSTLTRVNLRKIRFFGERF